MSSLVRPALKLLSLLCASSVLLVLASARADEEKAPFKAEPVADFEVKFNLYGVRTIDTKACILVGEAGTIMRSDDAGKTWKAQKSNTTADLHDVRFTTKDVGLAVGDGGKYKVPDLKDPSLLSRVTDKYHVMDGDNCWSSILRTDNGGKTWERVEAPTNLSLTSITWMDRQRAFVCTGDFTRATPSDGSLLSTEDAGKTWKMLFNVGNPCRAVAFLPDRSGWCVGFPGKKPELIRWNGKNIRSIKDLTPQDLMFLPPDFKRILTVPGEWNASIMKMGLVGGTQLSRDLMEAISAPIADNVKLYGMSINKDRVWVIGENGMLTVTEKKSNKWVPWRTVEMEEGTKVTLRAITFRDEKNGLVVGDSGVCLYTADGGKKWTKVDTGTEKTLHCATWIGNDALLCGDEGTLVRLVSEKVTK